ncbi:MAG TPA: DSD1 family PLP-dependent enzyme [Dehalococcoidia bacterium]|nr:DSD1 family PLP-dependent enzyme [Dehalococcoidia bacterium]
MERPIYQSIGTLALELDTPALVLDLAAMQQNIETLHGFFRQSPARVRPHVSCHQCPNIARRQMAAGGTCGGIAVASVGEAQVFSDAGFTDILVANQVVTPPKIRRLCALARTSRISVAVDHPANVSLLSAIARDTDVTLRVLVEVEAGLGRCGVAPGSDAVGLARSVAGSPNLFFQGLMAYEGTLRCQTQGELEAETRRRLQPVLETRELIEAAGLSVATVSVGGTHNYDIAGAMPGVTEVQAGSYALMDYNYCRYRPEFRPAAKILTSVLSHPIPSRAVVDAGHKAVGPDLGVPVLEGAGGATATRFSAEHGILDLENQAADGLTPNEKVWLVPFDLALAVNQYDYFRAVQNNRLAGFWPIAARGRFD